MKKKGKKVEKKNKVKKTNKKIGLPPGTVVYTGDKGLDQKISIGYTTYNSESYNYKIIKSIDEFVEHKGSISWLNIDGVHDVEIVKKIAEKKNIDSLIVEDLVSINQRPKIEERKDYYYIIMKTMKVKEPENEDERKKIEMEQFSMIVGKNYVLTFQEKNGEMFRLVRERIEWNIGNIRERGSDYLAYELLDMIVDNYFLVIENMEEELDIFEEKLLIHADKEDLEKIIRLKKEFFQVKRNIILANDIVGKLSNIGEFQLFGTEMKYYIQDLHDHTSRLNDLLENLTSLVHSLSEIYHSSQNKQINDIMKIFTIITTIFVPITFISGFYGMNIEGIPLLDSFGAVFTIMLTVTVGMIIFFKKKRWI